MKQKNNLSIGLWAFTRVDFAVRVEVTQESLYPCTRNTFKFNGVAWQL